MLHNEVSNETLERETLLLQHRTYMHEVVLVQPWAVGNGQHARRKVSCIGGDGVATYGSKIWVIRQSMDVQPASRPALHAKDMQARCPAPAVSASTPVRTATCQYCLQHHPSR